MSLVVGTTIFIERSLSTDNEILFSYLFRSRFFYYPLLFNNFFETLKITRVSNL